MMNAVRILLILGLAPIACDDSDECWENRRIVSPRMGLALPSEVDQQIPPDADTTRAGDTCGDEPTCDAMPGLCPGDAFVVIHQLSSKVGETQYPLKLGLTTSCAEAEIEAHHIDGLVLRPVTAPPCAETGLVVTAEIANSRLQCRVPPIDVESSTSDVCAPQRVEGE